MRLSSVILVTGLLASCGEASFDTLEADLKNNSSSLAASQTSESAELNPNSQAQGNSQSLIEASAGIATTDASENTNSTSSDEVFTSSTSPDFTATLLEDAIQIAWKADGRARGYNIYRQGEYYETVFGNTYIDNNVSDGEVDYEIVAFDDDENFFGVASDLTVPIANVEQSTTAPIQLSSSSTPVVSVNTATEENSTEQVNVFEPSIGAAVQSAPDISQQTIVPSSQPSINTAPEEEPASKESTTGSSGESASTRFTSVTTPGFEGEVLDAAIRITWNSDPEARGYNVYKDADYYTTVFNTEFVDTNVYDDNYYYEIQAFDYDDKLYYIATGLTVSASTLGKTDPNAPKVNEALLEDYELVFFDEFNGSTIDKSKWNTGFIWGTDLIINNEEQYYVDINNEPDFGFNPFTFDGENLTINTIETPPELAGKALNQPYLSGIITSYDAFKFTYGYAETRAKMTHGRGYWPAFWLLNAYYGSADPEIDIMEFIGDNQDVVYHTYHYFDANYNLVSSPSVPVPGSDYTADFHTFGAEWMPGRIIFYINGIETYRIEDPNVSSEEMYVLANQAVGGWWAGSPDETTPFPGKYIIDYIRVYQRTTPYSAVQFDQASGEATFSDQTGINSIPNKRPTYEQWPEGYPWR